MKTQLTFFTDVLGMELYSLFWMHGVEGAWHAFLRLNERSSLSFVYIPGVRPGVRGVSFAGHAAEATAAGSLQHVALRVDDLTALVTMRDRIRAHGVPVFGPYDHGAMCQSIYFAGPEGLNLEIAASDTVVDPDDWIDPEVVALAGISAEELARMRTPVPDPDWPSPVPQPKYDPSKPHLGHPPDKYAKMLKAPDPKPVERKPATIA